jgi:predicted RNA-binding protein YlxR (DUF448 family)
LTPPSGHIPLRTCVVCGRRAPQGQLLRLALEQGRLRPDPRRRLPGRGAYLCPTKTCLQALRTRLGNKPVLGKKWDQPAWTELGEAIERTLARGFGERPRSI